jgi:GT2 family glycosyltransferase
MLDEADASNASPTHAARVPTPEIFEGHVDFFGCHAQARGWFFGGWISHPWPPGHRPQSGCACFANVVIPDFAHSVFYHREDVSGRGIGYVFFFRSDETSPGDFELLQIDAAARTHDVHPTPNALMLDEAALVEHLRPILAGGDEGSQSLAMLELLTGQRPPQTAAGFIDLYGHCLLAGGWMFCGWIGLPWPPGAPPAQAAVTFEDGDMIGEAFATLYPRPDLQGKGEGIVLFVRGNAPPLGRLASVGFAAGQVRACLHAAPATARLRESELVARLRPLLGAAAPVPQRDALLGLLARRPYGGEDTLAALDAPVWLEIDEAILCGGDGLLLMGWRLARPGDIAAMRVRSGPLAVPLDLRQAVRVRRPDVLEQFAGAGFTDPSCGFIAFLPQAVAQGERLYIEVETTRHEVGYRTVPPLKLDGIAAMQRVLGAVDCRFDEVQEAFDRVVGPAVDALNRSRLAHRPAATVTNYGDPPRAPRYSVIVPLHGRLDFVEYQLAMFSAHPASGETEFIYVLDDPPKLREAQFLFASVYERFLTPFRAVLLDRNVGFGPANNIGLAHASGEFVIYLNSDVFPGTADWLERLARRLCADPTLGVVGPVLLFEDGSVQHRGMRFERLPEFGNWFFGMHEGKGLRHPGGPEVQRPLSITGACMMLPRALAERAGGFDERYAVGDFEDSDLCLRLRAMGYACGIVSDVQLFHLERKSQASSAVGWRMNLTVYNAWQHQRRWGDVIAAHQTAEAGA